MDACRWANGIGRRSAAAEDWHSVLHGPFVLGFANIGVPRRHKRPGIRGQLPGGCHASQWVESSRLQIGYTSLFVIAIDLRPFLDVVWSAPYTAGDFIADAAC